MRTLLLILFACDDRKPVPEETGPASTDSADSDSADSDSADSDSGEAAPTGDSIDDPVWPESLSGDMPISDAMDPEGDVDWYAVDLEEGQFLGARAISVEGDPEDPEFDCDGIYDTNPIDLVLEVYDPAGERAAWADDWALQRCGYDPIALVCATEAGTWTVRVLDFHFVLCSRS